jgi:methyl-accepting chemotaxis protein
MKDGAFEMRVSVGTKLLSGFGLVIGLLLIAGSIAVYNLAILSELTERMYTQELGAIRNLAEIRAAVDSHRLATIQLADAPDAAERETLANGIRNAEANIAREVASLRPQLYRTDAINLLSQFETAWASYKAINDQMIAAITAGNVQEAERLRLTTSRERRTPVTSTLDQIVAIKDQNAANAAQSALQTYLNVRNVTLGLFVVAVLVALAVGLWLSRTIGRGLRSTAATAELIAAGDLTQSVKVQSTDEVGDLGGSFNRMVRGLRALTAEIRDGAQDLSAATSEILASVTQQSASMVEQATAVSQTTATVDEVRVTAEQARQKGQVVATQSQDASETAALGLEAIDAATKGMDDVRARVESIAEKILLLSEQTQQVGEIITTVADLADQSNLLAVNAAIEASRAGEQGRGFAVVAQEVRSLAERSKAATAQVRTILTDIQRATNAAVMATEQGTKGADEGSRLVDQAGQTIRQLDRTIHQSAEAAQMIVASVGQVGIGMDQIAAAMGSINQSTSETSAGTRQLQRAAESMNNLAQRLTDRVGRYKLDGPA